MADVFISYAREDMAHAVALEERLIEAGLSVWRDDRLQAGDAWRKEIRDALDAAGLVVVIWSQDSIESRWVLSEAERAANQNKLVAMCIDEVELPLGLDQLQFENVLGWHPGDEHEGVDRLLSLITLRIGRTEAEREDDEARAYRRLKRIAREAKRTTLVALPTAFALLLLLGAGAIDQLTGWDTRLRLLSLQAHYLISPPALHPDVAVVIVDDESLARLSADAPASDGSTPSPQEFGPDWRGVMARAVETLVEAGARSIALDMTFGPLTRPTSLAREGTERLGRAIEAARAKNIAVSLNAKGLDDAGRLVVHERIRRALGGGAGQGAPPRGLSDPCVGLNDGLANKLPLMVSAPGAPRLHALSLAALEGLWGLFANSDARHHELTLSGPTGQRIIPIAGLEKPIVASAVDRRCPLPAGHVPAMLLFAPLPQALSRGHRAVTPLEDLLTKRDFARFHDRLVLIGGRFGTDLHAVFRCRDRPPGCGVTKREGVDLHAAAINTMLRGVGLWTLSPLAQLLLMTLLCVAAAYIRLRHPIDARRRRLWLAGLVALDLVGVFAAAALFELLMDAVYHVLAALTAAWLIGYLDDASR